MATKICKFSAGREGGVRRRGVAAQCQGAPPLCGSSSAQHQGGQIRWKSHWEGSHPRFSTTSAFRNQQRKPEMCHLSECQNKQEMVITSEEKQGLELRPDHRGHLSNTISSLSPYFMKTLHKYPLKQTH